MNNKQPPTIEDRQTAINGQMMRQNLADAINNLALAFEREDAYKAQIAELTAKNKDLEAKLNPTPAHPQGSTRQLLGACRHPRRPQRGT